MEKKFIQCSVSFQGQGNTRKYKNPSRTILNDFNDFLKLYTLSNLVIYTFTFRYSLASRSFQTPNIMWYAQNFQWVQNSIFPNGKFIFSNSFSLINT